MSTHPGLSAPPSVRLDYARRVADGELTPDPAQEAVAARLDRLIEELSTRRTGRKSGALGWLLSRRKPDPAPRGVYLYGGVGRGKTMLMDLFFRLAPVRHKRRAHFNDFMTDVHDRIAAHRAAVKAGTAKGDDPIPPIAAAIAEASPLLCFDEFTVTDIADAMILSRLFTALFDSGVVLVATSNVAPDDLYRDGLNRGLFLPFVDVLKAHVDIVPLDIPTDYRMLKLSHMPVYVAPLNAEAQGAIDDAWAAASEGHVEAPVDIQVMGRTIHVARAAGRAARFQFEDLCSRPLAARDYLAISDRFDLIFVENIPVMAESRRNEAKRFILLVDTLYDRHKRIVASAEAQPDDLYRGKSGTEAFEFARTASRLNEMRSHEWIEAAQGASRPSEAGVA